MYYFGSPNNIGQDPPLWSKLIHLNFLVRADLSRLLTHVNSTQLQT